MKIQTKEDVLAFCDQVTECLMNLLLPGLDGYSLGTIETTPGNEAYVSLGEFSAGGKLNKDVVSSTIILSLTLRKKRTIAMNVSYKTQQLIKRFEMDWILSIGIESFALRVLTMISNEFISFDDAPAILEALYQRYQDNPVLPVKSVTGAKIYIPASLWNSSNTYPQNGIIDIKFASPHYIYTNDQYELKGWPTGEHSDFVIQGQQTKHEFNIVGWLLTDAIKLQGAVEVVGVRNESG